MHNSFIKKLTCFVLCGVMLLMALPAFAMEKGDELVVINCQEYVSLRKSASSSSSRVAKVPYNERVNYAGETRNGFTKVYYGESTGYILDKYLAEAASLGDWGFMPRTGDSLYVCNCSSYVSLREKPSSSSTRLAQVTLYESVDFKGIADNGFVKVTYNGQTGYILHKNLDVYEPQIAADGNWEFTPQYGDSMWIVLCSNYVSLRMAPSKTASQIARVPLGAKVTYLANYDYTLDGFSKVQYGDKVGYVLAKYLDQYEPQG